MKKLLCMLLAVILVLSMAACGGNTQTGGNTTNPTGPSSQQTSSLKVGYGRASITPGFSVPLGGYGNVENRFNEDILDEMLATCTVFEEGDNKVMMFSTDCLHAYDIYVLPARKAIHEATGFPEDNIMIGSTHSHSTPALGNTEFDEIDNFMQIYIDGLVKAAKEALADMAPATIYSATTKAENMNFVRHYLMNDGTYAGPNFGNWSSGIKDHAAENDPNMQLLQIVREGDKKPILLMNWGAHPCFTGGTDKKDLSADYIGTCRAKIERETDMNFMFLLAACGNQNGFTEIADEPGFAKDANIPYGEALAQFAIDALPNMKKMEGNAVSVMTQDFTYNINHADEHLLEKAKEVVALWNKTGSRDEGNKLARQYGMSSVYHANSIIARVSRPKEMTFPMSVFRVGELAFVCAPYEMFAASGMYIKEKSPFDMTIISTVTNDGNGYFPTMDAYDYGCYESFTCIFERGIAEAAAERFVQMLTKLHEDPSGTSVEVQGGIKSDITNDSIGNWTDATSLPAQGTWKLDTDVTLTEMLTVRKGYQLTIDLNGHKISRTIEEKDRLDQSLIRVVNGGKLTIKDSNGQGAFSVAYGEKGIQRTPGAVLYVEPGAEAVIDGGNFDLSALTSQYDEGKCGIIYTDGKLTVSGGTFKGFTRGVKGDGSIIAGSETAEITITGGTFQSGVTGSKGGAIYTNGKLTIGGGEFSAKDGGAVAEYGGLICVEMGKAQAAQLTITGGTFKGAQVTYGGGCIYADAPVTISGGSFLSGKCRMGGVMTIVDNDLTITGGTFQGIEGGATVGSLIHSSSAKLVIEGGTFTPVTSTKDGYTIFYERNDGYVSIGGTAVIDGGIVVRSTRANMLAKLYLKDGAVIDSAKANVTDKYDLRLRNTKIFINGNDTGVTAPNTNTNTAYDIQYNGTAITGVQ